MPVCCRPCGASATGSGMSCPCGRGQTPLRALAAAFNPRADDEGAAEYATKITNEADELRTGDPELLSHMIREELDRAEGKPDRLLLYIDQWEELYAQAPSSSDKERAASTPPMSIASSTCC